MASTNYLKPSKVKRFMKESGMRVSKTYIAVLDHEVQALMEKHARIAKQDRRKTVMAIDISLSQTIKTLSRDLKR
jgi:histone H3/H4